MNLWQEKALEYHSQGLKPKAIATLLENELGLTNMYHRVKNYIYRTGKKVAKPVEKKRLMIQNQEPERYDQRWDGVKTIKFAVISDTHFSSKYVQMSYLHDFYDLCEREGVAAVYHAGDITDGLKMRPGHEYEIYEGSADGQIEDIVNNYPRREGITTYFITGNHDASLYKHVGYDIGAAIARRRDDMVYLGRDCAVVNLTPNCTLELRHPWDGISYALSYRIQKMIEGMESDSKPNIVAVGHYHKQGYFIYRNVHALLPGCFQAQTPFLRGKGSSVILGGYIVTAHVDDDGTIQRFLPEFRAFYKSVADDYKNFKR